MENIYVKHIIDIMMKYCKILKVIGCKNLNHQLKEIGDIMNYISVYSDISLDAISIKFEVSEDENIINNKQTFKDKINLLNIKEYSKISGIKLKYDQFNDKDDVVNFINNISKSELLKFTTLIDLNLIYYLLNGNTKFIKKKKEEVYSNIITYIKAMKQGEAFKNIV